MRRGVHRLLATAGLAAMAWLTVPGAQAQTLLPHSDALACLTPPPDERGVPEYDPELVRRKDGGTIKVELVFRAPDEPPVVRVLNDTYFEALAESVRRHVRRFRVPCLPPGGEPARLQFDFVFTPEDGRPVYGLPPRDAEEASRREAMKCLIRIGPERVPEYPAHARRHELQGHYIVRLLFTSPTEPPEWSFVFGPEHKALKTSLGRFISGYRLPCMGQAAVSGVFEFIFMLEGGSRSVMRDMSLQRLLNAATRYTQPVVFDLDAMRCPFDIRMSIRQPYIHNSVTQVGERVAEREPLMRWLSEMHFRVTPDKLPDVIGKPFTVSVPCGKVVL